MDNIMIGIDFGTTNTSITYMRYNSYNDNFTPECFSIKSKSYMKTLVTYKDAETYWIGEDALNRAYQYPKGFVKSIKRKLIGEIASENNVDKSQVDIISDILKQLKAQIEPQLPLDTQISGIVMGVPIGFSDISKNIYLEALIKAGFYSSYEEAREKSIFVSEPIAAVLDYNLSLKEDKKIMVFDFGGGTLDLVVMQMKNVIRGNEINEHEVIAKGGNLKLGGDDFDRAILEDIIADKYGIRKLKRELGITSFDDILTVREGIELMKSIQSAKEDLSNVQVTDISVVSGDFNINLQITREEFELAIKPYMNQIKDCINKCLTSANRGLGTIANDIDVVVLSGGSSLIPLVRQTLNEVFGRHKVKVHGDAMTSIARGLALRGHHYDNMKYSDILDNSYGVIMLDTNTRSKVIRSILNKGDNIKELNANSHFKEFILNEKNSGRNFFKVTICENEEEIGTARIPLDELMKYSRFKLYFSVDENLEQLELHIFDTSRNQKVEVPIEHRYITIN